MRRKINQYGGVYSKKDYIDELGTLYHQMESNANEYFLKKNKFREDSPEYLHYKLLEDMYLIEYYRYRAKLSKARIE